MKKGLVLEGGAMRGMFTAGILDVFMEHDIDFDGAVGVSAGAVFGCNYKSKQIGRSIRYNKKYCTDDRYVSLKSWITTGDLYGAEFSYHTLPKELDVFDTDAFAKSPMEFYVVCTDMLTGRAVYHKCTDGGENDIQWMRASASLPFAARPVELAGRVLSDGGTADSIPVKFMEYKGYDKLVVILTQPKGYVKHQSRMMPVMKKVLGKYPNFIGTMSRRYMRYNKILAYIEQQEKLGRLFVIRPDTGLAIGKVCRNPDELERVYQIGREKAYAELERIKEYLCVS
ncbi:MAG: patatin family protein [Clostridium sp.]|nr:patatin family protein [Clostridium sp.]MCM1209556.1 patatin family protein [Ruminococcus sp.]